MSALFSTMMKLVTLNFTLKATDHSEAKTEFVFSLFYDDFLFLLFNNNNINNNIIVN